MGTFSPSRSRWFQKFVGNLSINCRKTVSCKNVSDNCLKCVSFIVAKGRYHLETLAYKRRKLLEGYEPMASDFGPTPAPAATSPAAAAARGRHPGFGLMASLLQSR